MKLIEELSKRKEYLEKVIESKTKALEKVPDGKLKVNQHYGGWQYYRRRSDKDKNGKYIRKGDVALAMALAQKDYDKDVLELAIQELERIREFEQCYHLKTIEDIYADLPTPIKAIVNPIKQTDEEYLTQWILEEYDTLPFKDSDPEYFSDRGERMRSKSECLIANMMNKYGLNYRYEKPLKLNGYGIFHPDFTILDLKNRREIYWEHFGMLDDREYRDNMISKLECFEKNDIIEGDRLILTRESLRKPINMKIVEIKILRLLG